MARIPTLFLLPPPLLAPIIMPFIIFAHGSFRLFENISMGASPSWNPFIHRFLKMCKGYTFFKVYGSLTFGVKYFIIFYTNLEIMFWKSIHIAILSNGGTSLQRDLMVARGILLNIGCYMYYVATSNCERCIEIDLVSKCLPNF